MEQVVQEAGLPLIGMVVCLYLGMRVLVLKDYESVLGKQQKEYQDRQLYAMKTAQFLLLYAALLLLFIFLELRVSPWAAIAEIILATVIMAVCWPGFTKDCGPVKKKKEKRS